MFTLVKRYKREFVYSSYLFLVFELLLTPGFVVNKTMYYLTVATGVGLIVSWLLHTYNLYAKKEASKQSDVLIKINMKERFFSHVLLPLVFYLALTLFLFVNSNVYINQLVVVISSVMFFYLFLNIRTAYDKVFYIHKTTRVIYDFITVTVFYLSVSVISSFGLSLILTTGMISMMAAVAFLYMLFINNKLGFDGLLMAFLSSMIVLAVSAFVFGGNIFTSSAIIATTFYTIISLWHVRFAGARDLDDYIPPIMYTLMTLILILGL